MTQGAARQIDYGHDRPVDATAAPAGDESRRASGRLDDARRVWSFVLMVVAAVVAAIIGQVVDGALLIVIFATSG